jgi:hypothetical protein
VLDVSSPIRFALHGDDLRHVVGRLTQTTHYPLSRHPLSTSLGSQLLFCCGTTLLVLRTREAKPRQSSAFPGRAWVRETLAQRKRTRGHEAWPRVLSPEFG